MKHLSYIALLAIATLIGSCGNSDEFSKESVFQPSNEQSTELDTWLDANFVKPYNIEIRYRFKDDEAAPKYYLAPIYYPNAIKMANIIKHSWIDAYVAVAGADFIKNHSPKLIYLVGSPAFESTGAVGGVAEGGMKITLYSCNELRPDRMSPEYLNDLFFRVMHHEFSHILHHAKNYPVEYERLSEGKYIKGDWYTKSDPLQWKFVLRDGFISAYAMSEPSEDIAEMTAYYLTKTPTEWQQAINEAGYNNGTGDDILLKKLAILKQYMMESWGIDLDKLRTQVQLRLQQVTSGQVDIDHLN